jgi:pyruvate dehydrogenase complex dehydrogenase (E1) component
LAFLGSIAHARVASLGVQRFGPAGSAADVHSHHRLDADAIAQAALDLLDVEHGRC